ncbi:MAG: acyl-CoA carboxylase subunit beta [Dehalococcoidales bacterium]|nr:acyl-CoA carboxylase subunit beta [Dehalococcoidales bacterium]
MMEETEAKQKQLAQLELRRQTAMAMGGAEKVDAQKKRGKLTARERIKILLDPDTFREIGMFAKNRNTAYGEIPSDGVIAGYGKIGGRKVYVYSQDFTSMGGTLSETHANKICHILGAAIKSGCPVIGLNDSGGARIQDGIDALSGYGRIFYRNTMASGVIPQISAIVGPTAGGAVYSPALTDFIFMVKDISFTYITGPRVVEAVTREKVTDEDLGGAAVAQKKSGVVCRSEESENECYQNIRELLSYLPSSNRSPLPMNDWGDNPDRKAPSLFDLVPANPSRPYSMFPIIEQIFDQRKGGRKNYFELFPLFATNIITCFSWLNKRSVGIIANQPNSKAGCLDIDTSDKASRFIRFCDAFNIPLINLVDVPGYLPGTAQEWGGVIRHGAKMLYAYSEATVPKITLIIRKAYGGSYLGMCSKDLGADAVFAWPSAELAVMGAEGAAPIIFRRELEKAAEPEKLLQEKIKEYREEFANPYRGAEHLHVDDVIDPAETRQRLIDALEMAADKVEMGLPRRKHGVGPT